MQKRQTLTSKFSRLVKAKISIELQSNEEFTDGAKAVATVSRTPLDSIGQVIETAS